MIDKWIILLVAIGFGIARFLVPVTGGINHADIFKDAAHLFVGGCFGAAIKGSIERFLSGMRFWSAIRYEWKLWAIAWGLTAIEVVAFILRKS